MSDLSCRSENTTCHTHTRHAPVIASRSNMPSVMYVNTCKFRVRQETRSKSNSHCRSRGAVIKSNVIPNVFALNAAVRQRCRCSRALVTTTTHQHDVHLIGHTSRNGHCCYTPWLSARNALAPSNARFQEELRNLRCLHELSVRSRANILVCQQADDKPHERTPRYTQAV
jgi:hypothetical protein